MPRPRGFVLSRDSRFDWVNPMGMLIWGLSPKGLESAARRREYEEILFIRRPPGSTGENPR